MHNRANNCSNRLIRIINWLLTFIIRLITGRGSRRGPRAARPGPPAMNQPNNAINEPINGINEVVTALINWLSLINRMMPLILR